MNDICRIIIRGYMETRKKIFGAECLFTALIVVYEIVTVLALFTDLFSGITIKQNILFSQSLIFVPTVLYLFIMRKHVKDIIWFRRFHPLTLLLLPPLVLFMEPLITLLNAISMLFVRNEISHAASALVDHNTLGTSLFFMAFLPCVIEELAYRGVMFGSFHEAGRLKAILMSGFLFGLMHMNFNQMPYAIYLGLIMVVMMEASDSIVTPMLMHFFMNGISTLSGFFSEAIKHIANIIPMLKDQAENTEVTQTMLLSTIRAYIPMALVGTVISAGIIYLLATINGRMESFTSVFTEPFNRYDENGKKLRLLTPLMIVVIIYCLIRCVVEEFLF